MTQQGQLDLEAARARLCHTCTWWRPAAARVGMYSGSPPMEAHCEKRLEPLTSTGEDCPYWKIAVTPC